MTLALDGATVSGRTRDRLAGVSLKLARGVPTVVVGPNGAGKSTLVRALVGLETLAAGRLTLDGIPLASRSRAERAAATAWLPQHPRLEEGLTAVETVAAARYRFAEPLRISLTHAREALDALGAGALAERPMDRLSGGEAQRVRLAALHAQQAAWWLLDEPFNHLDPGVRLELLELVAARAQDGAGVVLVTHDVTVLPWLSRARVVALDEGRIVHDGPAALPELAGVLGPLLGVRLEAVELDGALRLVIAGRQ